MKQEELNQQFAIIGSGSFATALAKILNGNGVPLNWCVRNQNIIDQIKKHGHNPSYLRSATFNTSLLTLTTNLTETIEQSDYLILAIPSAYTEEVLDKLPKDIFEGKQIISAIKGIMPNRNILLNDYLKNDFGFDPKDYYTIMGPCHAEEVASEKLSYLTFTGLDQTTTQWIADQFRNHYINTVINDDVYGVQFAAILKNIYALGSGIAHGLEYGDNFLSVLIANAADEMAGFLRKVGIRNMEVGVHKEPIPGVQLMKTSLRKSANYAASVYMGDLLVTCYSLYSRNRTFGNMIGKGFSVKAAQLEMNMVAEGYNASKCFYLINKELGADMPIATAIYKILWEDVQPAEAFEQLEQVLI
ncbi:NAD(P)H-dependent glycerol-3-phosphate dehydrogenase [Lacibacter sediminis]|uniref:Glycerol-3-phosphate dehydrogenase n=1 Tax=Lacibacter sediminis TaxID=2760713 RepID=A0A7G5XEQ5_9BACT|nr:NAD(P)H-dependent glycerol-3-phosphate dehydrogenase [Lacibacter sediminis]QNA43958.1 NAD(P)-binding domain-containing protein [Lacibacter sediminis]